jgi:predicted naringenin-chalcone synthase
VEDALGLAGGALDHSRDVLRAFGNMSSATIVFVLARLLERARESRDAAGCALAFGPGMICETMRFSVVS